MSGSRSRRRRKRGTVSRDTKTAPRGAAEPARRKPAVAAPPGALARDAKAPKDADPAALRAEVRALRRGLAEATAKLGEAEAKRTRAVARATAALRRENETLEAHLTLLVQEIGQIKHIIDRVPRLEADLRAKELQLAERERAWDAERKALQAEITRLAAPAEGSPKAARAAAGVAAYEPAG
jgi:hypothetical protein